MNRTIVITGLGSVNMSIWDFNLRNMSIGTKERIITLGENNLVRLNMKDFKADLNTSYAYLTNPPLLADIGEFLFHSNGTNMTLNGTIFLNDE